MCVWRAHDKSESSAPQRSHPVSSAPSASVMREGWAADDQRHWARARSLKLVRRLLLLVPRASCDVANGAVESCLFRIGARHSANSERSPRKEADGVASGRRKIAREIAELGARGKTRMARKSRPSFGHIVLWQRTPAASTLPAHPVADNPTCPVIEHAAGRVSVVGGSGRPRRWLRVQ